MILKEGAATRPLCGRVQFSFQGVRPYTFSSGTRVRSRSTFANRALYGVVIIAFFLRFVEITPPFKGPNSAALENPTTVDQIRNKRAPRFGSMYCSFFSRFVAFRRRHRRTLGYSFVKILPSPQIVEIGIAFGFCDIWASSESMSLCVGDLVRIV